MRDALASLLESLRWLGGLVLTFFSSLFLFSWKNQRGGCIWLTQVLLVDSVRGHGKTRQVRRRCGRQPMVPISLYGVGRCPARLKRKRSRPWHEDRGPSHVHVGFHVNPNPAKKSRHVWLREWRFRLPSSVDLVGEISLLSTAEWCSNIPASKDLVGVNSLLAMVREPLIDINNNGKRRDVQVGEGGRDFAAEAAEIRTLRITQPFSSPTRPAGELAGTPIGKGKRGVSPQPRIIGICRDWANQLGLDFPRISEILDWGRYISSQRDYPSRAASFLYIPNPSQTPTPNCTVTLRSGLQWDLGDLFIILSQTPISSSYRLCGRPATIEAPVLWPSLRTCSGNWLPPNESSFIPSCLALSRIYSSWRYPDPDVLVSATSGGVSLAANPIRLSCCQELQIMAHVSDDQVVQFSLEEVQSTRFRASRTLLGRLFTNDHVTTMELRGGLLDAWKIRGQLKVMKTKQGLFEIIMPNEEAKQWALSINPWIIKDQLLTLRQWSPVISKGVFEEMARAPFRVQLWGVQEDLCTKLFGQKLIAATMGKVLDSGIFACKDSGERFIKVNTIIDFSKPLRSQLMVVCEEVDSFWVSLKYEFLPNFCFRCGRVGHARRDCSYDPPNGKERFGPHMITKQVGRKIYDEEGADPLPGGPRRSVWVNRQHHNNIKADRGEVGPGMKNVPQAEPSSAAAGEAPLAAKLTVNKGKSKERSPTRRGSPGRVILHRHPKVRIGKTRPKLTRAKEDGPQLDPSTHPRHASPQTNPPACMEAEAGSEEDQFVRIQAETRRRRLLLDADSDDDMLDVPGVQAGDEMLRAENPSPPMEADNAQGKGKPRHTNNPRGKVDGSEVPHRKVKAASGLKKEKPSVEMDDVGLPVGVGDVPRKNRKPRRSKSQPLANEGAGVVPRSISVAVGIEDKGAVPRPQAATVIGEVKPRVGVARGGRKLRKAHGDVAGSSLGTGDSSQAVKEGMGRDSDVLGDVGHPCHLGTRDSSQAVKEGMGRDSDVLGEVGHPCHLPAGGIRSSPLLADVFLLSTSPQDE
ncbi:unnamed protein product [Linum tenue]|uniref:CCHC-type domain-containing protein n=1 Tax=Linum tenue TaxID=586396 RepID=A0AAV0GU96_9ROSI|nr:unnamed protein product [Linum tenue]CAI0376719.1 unnamed protein product [Linum tenue]